jgi:hypothetical protein
MELLNSGDFSAHTEKIIIEEMITSDQRRPGFIFILLPLIKHYFILNIPA